jgi:predicted transcriptional regulator
MAIGEICSRDVVFIARNETCAEAARLMRTHHVGSLVVVREDAVPRVTVGMITDRDLAVGVMALGLDPEQTLVEAVTRPEPATIGEGEGIGRAIALMRTLGVRRLPVVNALGEPVGVIAADDLIDLFAEEMSGLAAMIAKGPRREIAERRAVP